MVWFTRSWVRLYAPWLLALLDFLVGNACRGLVGTLSGSCRGVVGKIWPDKCRHGLPGNSERAQRGYVQSLPFAQGACESQAAQFAHVVVEIAQAVNGQAGALPEVIERASLAYPELARGEWVALAAVAGCSGAFGAGVEDGEQLW